MNEIKHGNLKEKDFLSWRWDSDILEQSDHVFKIKKKKSFNKTPYTYNEVVINLEDRMVSEKQAKIYKLWSNSINTLWESGNDLYDIITFLHQRSYLISGTKIN